MDARKGKKHRSFAETPKGTNAAAGERPQLQDRSHSASNVTSRHQSQSKSHESSKTSSPSDRDPNGPKRDIPSSAPYQTTRFPEDEKLKAQAAKSREDTSVQSSPPHVNFVVLGPPGVGKSTFVQRALDLKQPPLSPTSAKKMSLDGVIFLVKLLEVPLDEVSIVDNTRIAWPEKVEDGPMPSVDGVLALLDVSDSESITDIPEVLKALFNSGVPCVLVLCKCDIPPHQWQIELGGVERLARSYGGLDFFQTSINSTDSQKKCISIMLRSIPLKVQDSPHTRGSTSPRRRAATSTKSPSSPVAKRDISDSKSHARAKSEIQRSQSREVADPKSPSDARGESMGADLKSRSSNGSKVSLHVHTAPSSRRNSRPTQPQTPRSANPRLDADTKTSLHNTAQDDSPPSSPITSKRQSLAPSIKSLSAFNSFLNMEDEESLHEGIETPSSPDPGKEKLPDKASGDVGFSFEELVDRLLSQPMSKQDGKFAAIFLCLYRKFAAPYQLLTSVMDRFEELEKPVTPQLARVGEQFRYLNILGQWVADYPGDFAHPKTQQKIAGFMRKLEKSRVFSYAAKEMKDCVEAVVEDDDTGWACHDTGAPVSEREKTLFSKSSDEDFGKYDGRYEGHDEPAELSPQSSAAPSYSSLPGKSASASNNSLSMLMTAETAQREAQSLNLVPRYSLNKMLWRQFMEIPEEDFARELTRMDWIMYCSLRPRDFVRHVGPSADQSTKSKTLANDNRMIAQFNRLAYFITNIILLRDKPKHRAQALEKCMNIAWKLRQMNNYNSLGAMVASISGTAVSRLALTREVVPSQPKKDFMRLEILMNPRRSYSAYRLAWENSFTERIPFVPLYRRDLVSAEEGSKTWIGENGDRINWRKFEIMGEVVISIQKSQGTPYAVINKNEEIKRLFLETKFSADDEELYERSIHIEPIGAGESRKKFNWLRGT